MLGKIHIVIFAALSLLHLAWGLNAPDAVSAITKGLPIAFLLVMAILRVRGSHKLVIGALFFSLCGDIVSELHLGHHLPLLLQIVFFAVAQICYIFEFRKYRPVSNRRKSLTNNTLSSVVPFFCCGYALLVVGNIVCASLQKRPHKAWFVSGAVIFAISDSTILARMIVHGFPCSGIIIMSTYYLAQFLLNRHCAE